MGDIGNEREGGQVTSLVSDEPGTRKMLGLSRTLVLSALGIALTSLDTTL